MNNLNPRDRAGNLRHRWGPQNQEPESESSLLMKKDQQIRRLQLQLQNQRKRADNALRMLDSFRSTQRVEEETSTNSKSQISRRLQAESQARSLRAENQKLKSLLMQHVSSLAQFKNDIQSIVHQ